MEQQQRGTRNQVIRAAPGQPVRFPLVLRRDFSPTIASNSGSFDLPLVFVGYGITAKPEGYDDYAGVPVAGKAVLLLRHKPQQANPEGVFNGIRDSEYAYLRRKIATAYEHGAAAVIVCTDQFTVRRQQRGDDVLLRYHSGPISHVPCDIPVVHVCRAVMDRAVRAGMGLDLAALEDRIDLGPAPHSAELAGWRIVGKVDIRRTEHEAKNVLGVLDGSGSTADETIILGAITTTSAASRAAIRSTRSRRFIRRRRRRFGHRRDDRDRPVAGPSAERPSAGGGPRQAHRRLLFVAFTGEETGHLGANTTSATRCSPCGARRPC